MVLWSHDMTISVGLKTELTKAEFIKVACEEHKNRTGDTLLDSEYFVTEEKIVWVLEVI